MSTVLLTGALDAHGPTWRGWVLRNLARGCTPRRLFRDMVRVTWQPDMAVRALDEALHEMGQPGDWLPGRPALGSHACLDAGDRSVAVLARSQAPDTALLQGLLSPEECAELVQHACERGLQRSGVVDRDSGASVAHAARTSTSVCLRRRETPLVALLEARLSRLTGWPADRAEGLQILRYERGQQYRPHHDWFDPARPGSQRHLARGGQRVGTWVICLQQAEVGGATWFPKARLALSPPLGGAVFFNNTDLLGAPDPMTLHAGAPVEAGVKVVATCWQRERAFGPP